MTNIKLDLKIDSKAVEQFRAALISFNEALAAIRLLTPNADESSFKASLAMLREPRK